MADQTELDLPAPAAAAPRRATAPPAKRGFGGFTRAQLALGLGLVAALIWSMWVTKTLVAPRQEGIVKARLSTIVGEYVSAQARSALPPAQVEAEMRTFMATLDRELQRRSASGQVVLVGEAVLTRNVPDITESLRKAVFASGVRPPRQASAEELQRLQQQLGTPAAPSQLAGAAPGAVGGATVDPTASFPPASIPTGSPLQPPPSMGAPVPTQPKPGASVSTFGGPDGVARQ